MKKQPTIAVLGPAGTFTETAARRMFRGALLAYMDTVDDVFKYVDEGRDVGVIAIENSLEGSVVKNLESLMEHDVKICKEATLDINLCLMKKRGGNLITTILSHPHALAQCKNYLKKNYSKAKLQSADSTIAAIKQARTTKNGAAIGPKEAAKTYGLESIAENIQDDLSQTRFIAISRQACQAKKPHKTSIIYAVKDEPGALYSVLRIFADNSINLTKIESRPSRKKLGEYVFYVDFENGGMPKEKIDVILLKIQERTTYLKNLGSY